MKYELTDESLMGGEGIFLYVSGEPGEKHPNLAIVIGEDELPLLKQIWKQGKAGELLMTVAKEINFVALWEHLLTLPNALGDTARAKESGKRL